MKTVIFCGPTLSEESIKEILPQALVLPPAEQGDLEYVCRNGAKVVGLVDGVHRQRLPVLHKECLQVLSAGTRVVGAASMGALRGVECEQWGFEVVGEVASWYRDGLIEADDEVYVSHLGPKHKWKAMSLPLVNVRATLRAGQVEKSRADEIIAAAKDIFYADRTWPRLFELCESSQEEREQILSCELDIKAADALHLCYFIAALPERPKPQREIKNAALGYGRVFLQNDCKIYNGRRVLRAHDMAFPVFRDAALNRALALEYCRMVGISERAPDVDVESSDDINKDAIMGLRHEEATLARGREWFSNAGGGFLDVPMINDYLRVTGMYANVKESVK